MNSKAFKIKIALFIIFAIIGIGIIVNAGIQNRKAEAKLQPDSQTHITNSK